MEDKKSDYIITRHEMEKRNVEFLRGNVGIIIIVICDMMDIIFD